MEEKDKNIKVTESEVKGGEGKKKAIKKNYNALHQIKCWQGFVEESPHTSM